MSAAFHYLKKQFSGRPDSEHEQAIVRLIIAALILLYLLYLLALQVQSGSKTGDSDLAIYVILTESLVGLFLLLAIAVKPGISHTRRCIGMVADYLTLAIFLSIKGEMLSPLYVVLLWVTIGNGLRYGTGYLLTAIAISLAAFAYAVVADPFWQNIPHLTIGLGIALVAIPAYLIPLLKNLHAAINEAKRANEAKSRFLATMSHEFRSPLNGIIGMADLMNRSKLSDDQKESAEIILISAQSLLLLVDDVLDISAIEAGKLNRHDVDFSLRELLARIRSMIQPHVINKKLQLVIQSADDVPDSLHGDLTHLTQILLNLMHNAVKFTEQGEVRLQVIRTAKGTGMIPLRFSVRDTGIGIALEDQERIFGAFEQVESGPTRRYNGTGLGTTISKTLTELLGGKIGLEENLGGGSHFWVDLELQESAVLSNAPDLARSDNIISLDDPFVRHRARVRPLLVLLADDQPTNRIVLSRMMERGGHKVISVANGEEALDAFAVGDIDLVILDMHMPELSGLDVLRQARVMQAGRTRVPFIIISADATPNSVQQAMEAGAHAYLTKPVVAHRLLDAIADTQKSENRNEQATARIQSPLLPKYRATVLSDLASMQLGSGFLEDFVEQCLRDIGQCLTDFQEKCRESDWDGSRDAAHALKGIAENLGAESLSEQCKNIMRASNELCKRDWRKQCANLEALVVPTASFARAEAKRLGESASKTGSPTPGED
jgi:two-component system, sensor histidine kinase RpfC